MNTIYIYHGTRADANTIRREGLQPVTPRLLLDTILREFGYDSVEEVRPKWVARQLRWYVDSREGYQAPGGGPGIHTTLSPKNACQYAEGSGNGRGEFAQDCVAILHQFARRRSKSTLPQGGTPKVVTIAMPYDELPERTRRSLESLWSIDTLRGHFPDAWDIKLGAIPPERIISIEECSK